MEPVTHFLTGACLARAGLNRRAAYATVTMVVAAEFPDIDMLWGLRGPVESFTHHRGMTHTFLGLPFEAALIVGVVYAVHRWRVRRASLPQRLKPDSSATPYGTAEAVPLRENDAGRLSGPLTAAPVRWGVLYGLAMVALLSHLLLDYTNNYGLRPFFPFNDHWYAASIVFIVDPLMLLLLAGALVAPALFGLVGAEVGARREKFRGRGWARAALVCVLLLWGVREFEHQRALQLAGAQSIVAPAVRTASAADAANAAQEDEAAGAAIAPDATPAPEMPTVYLSAQRVLASPDPLSPFRWYAATDFGPVYQLAQVDTMRGVVAASDALLTKPLRTPATLAAEASPLGRAYMDWSPMPVIEVSTADVPGQETTVTFRDPRFMRAMPFLSGSTRSALTGVVTLDARERVVEQSMDGRVER
jgi:inner membrane protein